MAETRSGKVEEKMGKGRKRIPDPVDSYVGERIRQRRRALALTQAQLAAVLGLSEQQLRRFERGSSRLSPRQLLALSLRLGVGPGYLLEGAPAASGASDAPEVIEMIQSFRAIRNDGMRRDLFLLVQAAARRSLAKSGREKPGVRG
jgi:transcriptional regulator with XRE-family HTH domain